MICTQPPHKPLTLGQSAYPSLKRVSKCTYQSRRSRIQPRMPCRRRRLPRRSSSTRQRKRHPTHPTIGQSQGDGGRTCRAIVGSSGALSAHSGTCREGTGTDARSESSVANAQWAIHKYEFVAICCSVIPQPLKLPFWPCGLVAKPLTHPSTRGRGSLKGRHTPVEGE